jgi:amino acid adenylation domain-containing protein
MTKIANSPLSTFTKARPEPDFLPLRGFLRSLSLAPENPALWVEGNLLSYAELAAKAAAISQAILANDPDPNVRTCAILAYRSTAAYSGILGILASGKAYVPLSPKLPPARNLSYLERTGSLVMLTEPAYTDMAKALIRSVNHPMILIIPDRIGETTHEAYGTHTILRCPATPTIEAAKTFPTAAVPEKAENNCYVLFTSGSTGTPKGVAVTSENVAAYIGNIIAEHRPEAKDRFSQVFDLTFDLSVHDMFVCWTAGATLYCLPEGTLMAPGSFIREHAITHWFSTPSTAATMERLGLLKTGSLSSIRRSLFCGEALPSRTARAWRKATSGAPLFNLYGPTETTIAITAFAFDESVQTNEENDIVPIGLPFKGQTTAIVDENLTMLPSGAEGELLLSGTQVTPGYWRDEQTTAERFVRLGQSLDVWYRTGDRAKRLPDGTLVYLGRMDQQIKIMGHRVDLMEVEAAIRQLSGSDLVAAVGWPTTLSGADGIVAFVSNPNLSNNLILEGCAKILPRYMVPRRIIELAVLPRTASGKIDRKALAATLAVP